MRRKRSDDGPSRSPPWITSYADMTQLLLTFFVLLFAFSSIDAIKFRQAVISLQGALGVLTGGPQLLNPGEMPVPKPPTDLRPSGKSEVELEGVKQEFQSFLKDQALADDVHLEITERGLVVSFMDKVLFDLGQADLRPEARRVLSEVAVILRKIPNDIRIEGHTCDLPIRTPKFPSNWELSTARACTVLRYFIEAAGLAPDRFTAMGYGEYRPKVPNTSEANRALNRRVDIVILKEKEKIVPPGEAARE
ncbi:MAG: chemotaxis protein MotB [Bacillota bacterium]|nr:OmpA family protein [Bacillota bacterium]MDK2931422.1 chemotaxis protein MotB [Bacillota bacterium]